MNLRFVSWNLNGFVRGGTGRAARFDAGWDVCAVQEATTLDAFTALAEPCAPRASRRGRTSPTRTIAPYVCGLLARPSVAHRSAGRARRAVAGTRAPRRRARRRPPRDGRAAWRCRRRRARLGCGGRCRQALAIADWLARRERPTVVGIDANTPRWDRLDLAATEFWNDGEERLLGPRPDHDLRDVFREVVERDPDRRATIAAERPDGPLAVSHVRGHGERATPCRYDFVLASPDVAVVDADYRGRRHAPRRATTRSSGPS